MLTTHYMFTTVSCRLTSVISGAVLTAPKEEAFLSILRDCKAQDDSPNETKYKARRAILDIRRANVDELQFTLFQVIKD